MDETSSCDATHDGVLPFDELDGRSEGIILGALDCRTGGEEGMNGKMLMLAAFKTKPVL